MADWSNDTGDAVADIEAMVEAARRFDLPTRPIYPVSEATYRALLKKFGGNPPAGFYVLKPFINPDTDGGG